MTQPTRKRHVRVRQERYLEVLADLEAPGARCDDLAEFLDVHWTTAWRNLEGLVFQEKLRRLDAGGMTPAAEYALA